MKILKILGIVAGLHAFALLLILANPGCSSASRPATAKDDPPAKPAAAPLAAAAPDAALAPAPLISAPVADGSDAGGAPLIRYSPTRPGTPVASALETQPVADVTPATTYTVAKGDSLWTVAKKKHLTISDLASANKLKAGSALHVGQKLILPSKSGVRPASVSTAGFVAAGSPREPAAAPPARAADSKGGRASPDSVRHTVKPGETLGAIARHYKVKVGAIATANNISDPKRIHPGQELIIPGPKAAGVPDSPAPTDKSALPIPGSGQDAGAKPAAAGEVPVIQVDESPAAPSAKP